MESTKFTFTRFMYKTIIHKIVTYILTTKVITNLHNDTLPVSPALPETKKNQFSHT